MFNFAEHLCVTSHAMVGINNVPQSCRHIEVNYATRVSQDAIPTHFPPQKAAHLKLKTCGYSEPAIARTVIVHLTGGRSGQCYASLTRIKHHTARTRN